jgi:hypothetical protein
MSGCFDVPGGAGIRGDKNSYGDGLGFVGTDADNCVKYYKKNYCALNPWVRNTYCRRSCGECAPCCGENITETNKENVTEEREEQSVAS